MIDPVVHSPPARAKQVGGKRRREKQRPFVCRNGGGDGSGRISGAFCEFALRHRADISSSIFKRLAGIKKRISRFFFMGRRFRLEGAVDD